MKVYEEIVLKTEYDKCKKIAEKIGFLTFSSAEKHKEEIKDLQFQMELLFGRIEQNCINTVFSQIEKAFLTTSTYEEFANKLFFTYIEC
jgi:hypothetical protein